MVAFKLTFENIGDRKFQWTGTKMKEERGLNPNSVKKSRSISISKKTVSFANVEEFTERVKRQDARIAAAESSSLRRFSADETKATATRNSIVMLWIQARRLLLEAVREIDAAIEPLNLGLSMVDDVGHGGLAGSVEIRLHRLDGGLPRSLLDIEIDLDGRHRTAVFDTRFPVQLVLPPIDRVRLDDYRTALMAFVHGIMRTTEPRVARRCSHCGQPALCFDAARGEIVSDEEHDFA